MKVIRSKDTTIRLDHDGYSTVIIPSKNNKNTICISSQVGCKINCSFCRAGPFKRDLSPDEMEYQFKIAANLIKKEQTQKDLDKLDPTSLVIMGMGEPMHNFENVSKAIEQIHAKYQFSYKKITLSTAGISLEKLEYAPYKIALSLHFTDDSMRKRYMSSTVAPVPEVVSFAKKISKRRKEGILIEYLLLKDINDSLKDLKKLLSFNWEPNTNFNIIECSHTGQFKKSDNIELFKSKIINSGYKCFIRSTRGSDIQASCGQLSYDQ